MSTRNESPLTGPPAMSAYALAQIRALAQDARNLESARDKWDESLDSNRVSRQADALRGAIDEIINTAGRLVGAMEVAK